MRIEIPFLFAVVNLFLGIFNFLPIPPLDGAALIERVLPRDWLPTWYQFRPYGFLILFVLVFWFHLGDRIFVPVVNHLETFVLR